MTAPALAPNALSSVPPGVFDCPDVELRRITKQFEGETVIRGVDLQVQPGEFFCILGPSGCGKTTLLRLMAGFETPSTGEVLIRGEVMNEIPPYRRPVNTVFQSYALFNHLTVAQNVAFGLQVKRLPKTEIGDRVAQALAGVKMETFAGRYPRQLSGGQRQRVALARALINQPTVILLDEPLGALDLKLRKEMQVELARLHQEVGLTFVMVTHDQEEALSLSDRIAVVRAGQIEQIGSPQEIYDQPRTAFVADFIGDTNLFTGTVEGMAGDLVTILTPQGLSLIAQGRPGLTLGQTVTVCIRPEQIQLTTEPTTDRENCHLGQLSQVMYLGTHVQSVAALAESGDRLRILQSKPGTPFPLNSPLYLSWRATDTLALVD